MVQGLFDVYFHKLMHKLGLLLMKDGWCADLVGTQTRNIEDSCKLT